MTKRAAYFTNINDMARFKKDIENIAKTDVEFFAVYCMNGDGKKDKRTIDSIVVKTLKPYENSGSELSNDGYDIWFYERKDNILTATNEAECIAMIKKGIECGICKLNINTELQIAWSNAVRNFLSSDSDTYDPRKVIKSGEEALKESVRNKIILLGCNNRG